MTDPPRIDWARAYTVLSPRERQILTLWLDGCGIVRTHVITGLSESTIRTHRRRIRLKLEQLLDDVT